MCKTWEKTCCGASSIVQNLDFSCWTGSSGRLLRVGAALRAGGLLRDLLHPLRAAGRLAAYAAEARRCRCRCSWSASELTIRRKPGPRAAGRALRCGPGSSERVLQAPPHRWVPTPGEPHPTPAICPLRTLPGPKGQARTCFAKTAFVGLAPGRRNRGKRMPRGDRCACGPGRGRECPRSHGPRRWFFRQWAVAPDRRIARRSL